MDNPSKLLLSTIIFSGIGMAVCIVPFVHGWWMFAALAFTAMFFGSTLKLINNSVANKTSQLRQQNQELPSTERSELPGEQFTRQRLLQECNRPHCQLAYMEKTEAIGKLWSSIAHEFNNLLTSMQGGVDLLKDNINKDANAMELLDDLNCVFEETHSLAKKIFTFARYHPAKIELLAINHCICEMETQLRNVAGSSNLQLQLELEHGCIKVDRIQFKQLLLNLVKNAGDVMHSKGDSIVVKTAKTRVQQQLIPCLISPLGREAEIDDASMIAGDYVQITVSDSGPGISEDMLSNIFEPSAYPHKGPKQGIGLAMILAIVQQHRGYIVLENKVPQGTNFHIYFPWFPQSVPVPDIETGQQSVSSYNYNILVVEDEPKLCELLIRALSKLGFKTWEANSAQKALQILEQEPDLKIDLLLTDVIMPEMSGRELAERICATYPDIKVLFMSGYTDDFLTKNVQENTNLQFIAKPFTIQELKTNLAKILQFP